jgi:KamA family protein
LADKETYVVHRLLPNPRKRTATSARVNYIRSVDRITQIPPEERAKLRAVTQRYAFRANNYYLGLIDWNDPDDPIRQLIIPREEELQNGGSLDASNEEAVTVAQGVQHKYPDTVLLLCNETCGAYCRYCFRKRLFMEDNDEVTLDVSAGLDYIAQHPGVRNVLLTGGDPLLMSTRRLAGILRGLRDIDHVEIVRIGSKMPAFHPWRILDDPELQSAFRKYSTPEKRIYLMAHFDHPRELTDVAIAGIDCFIRSGVICVNQCPIIKGVNDDPDVLAALYQKLSYIGCPPYYLFQCRPTAGNEAYELPIVRGWEVFTKTMQRGSGLARRARFVMSHETGKIEILAIDDRHLYLRYHRAKDPAMRGQFMIYKRSDTARWLDELEPAEGLGAPKFPPSSRYTVLEGPE